MFDNIPSEQRNPASEKIDSVSTSELLEIINSEDRKAAEAVRQVMPPIAEALDRIYERFRQGGRLIYAGAGTSGRLGALDAAELPPTYGLEPGRVIALLAGGRDALDRSIEGAEDDAGAGAGEIRELNAGPADSVLGIAASGRTPFVRGALEQARRSGALTVALTTNPQGAIAALADIAIAPATGPEVIAGSTRMKSGTAQKLVLNMLSTGLMVKMGYVLGNRMVNVQLKNEKLWRRALRMTAEIAGVPEDSARAALEATRDVRAAVLVARFGMAPRAANELLARHDGRLRDALSQVQRGTQREP